MPSDPRASVIIRTKNEEAWIGDTLTKVLQQRYEPFEVIIVDSGSTDRTLEIVKTFPVRLIEIRPEEFTYGRSLNRGMIAGGGEFLVSLSAHAVPLDRDWLKHITQPFADASVAGVVGKSLPHVDCNPFDRRGLLRRFGTEQRYLHHDSVITFSNANSAVRRSVWEQEPFDEKLPYSEDIFWFRRIKRQGWNVVYEPKAAVYHSHNETGAQLFTRFYNESRARSRIDPQSGQFTYQRLLTDLIAGSLYDIWTLLKQKQDVRWFPLALKRRYWINLGRYYGSRGIQPKRVKAAV